MDNVPRQGVIIQHEIILQNGRIDGPLSKDAPIIVSNGVGVDSVAMLIELRRLNIVPDAIVTSLVGREWFGNEHQRFYEYLPILRKWLRENKFPEPTYVWYEMVKKAKHFTYLSLAGNCIANRTLPSISFRRNKSCSLKYKGARIDAWVSQQYGDTPCYRLVGYDLSELYRAARFKISKTGTRANDVFVHPLQLLGLRRDGCEQVIQNAGLPSPGKSSCVFCASMKPYEVDVLNAEELWLIVIIEANAQPNLKKIRGLWGKERITDYILDKELLPQNLVAEVWNKWSAKVRPSEFRDSLAIADEILFQEIQKLCQIQ